MPLLTGCRRAGSFEVQGQTDCSQPILCTALCRRSPFLSQVRNLETSAGPRFCCASGHARRPGDDDPDRAGADHQTTLGAPEWVALLERRLGCRLAPDKPGPKPRMERDIAHQTQLL